MTNSSDTFGSRNCAVPQPYAPLRALKHNVSYVNFGSVVGLGTALQVGRFAGSIPDCVTGIFH